MAVDCRYPDKRVFYTRDLARTGARQIEFAVSARGETYQALYPYLCPCATHWHLSHYQQGRAVCPVCHLEVPAWYGGQVWVIGSHGDCSGEGQHAA